MHDGQEREFNAVSVVMKVSEHDCVIRHRQKAIVCNEQCCVRDYSVQFGAGAERHCFEQKSRTESFPGSSASVWEEQLVTFVTSKTAIGIECVVNGPEKKVVGKRQTDVCLVAWRQPN